MIKPYLTDFVNENKVIKNNSNEWKIQINMHVNLVSSNDNGENLIGFNRPIGSRSRLFRGVTSNHDGDFYCLNCLHSFRTDNVLEKHERLCDDNDYCRLEVNHGEKSLRTPFVIYADLECLLIKQQSCQSNPNESYTERKAIHEPCGYSLFTLFI